MTVVFTCVGILHEIVTHGVVDIEFVESANLDEAD